jgi:hypothetical protein
MPSAPTLSPKVLDLLRFEPDYKLEYYARDTRLSDELRLCAQQLLEERAEAKAIQYAALKEAIGFIHCGVKHGKGGDTWTRWMLFPPSSDDEEAIKRTGWHAFGPISDVSPTGKNYGWEPTVRRTRTRVLVTQHCGLDV